VLAVIDDHRRKPMTYIDVQPMFLRIQFKMILLQAELDTSVEHHDANEQLLRLMLK
jgi:hypothetical protein